jgi:protein SCO1/2
MNKAGKIIALFFLLIIPVFLAVFLKQFGRNEYKLDVFYPEGVISTNSFCNFEEGKQHTIPAFHMANQDGKLVTNEIFAHGITVVNFFFTSCPTICPTMNSEMLRVQESFENRKDIQILSFSVDPEYDTSEVLKEYGQRLGVNNNMWNMLTGDIEEIYSLARCGFILPVEHGGDDPFEFIHSEKFILVDKESRIRGYYDGTSRKDVDRLIIEIQVLLSEYGQL